MNFVYYLIFRLFTGLFFLFPFWVLFIISNLFYYLAFYIIGYRKKVVMSNLKNAFPEKSEAEIYNITKKFYKYLADIMVESLKGFTMSRKDIIKRHKILNPEILESYFEKNISIIGVSGHYGNWEWGSMSGGLQVKHHNVAYYKTLSNPYIDRFLKRSRQKCSTQLVSITETFDTFLTNKDNACAFLMIADQSPSNADRAIWINFLGIETAFLHGPEKYARMYNLPVLYIDIRPVRRGYYELELIPITDAPNELKEGELTRLYGNILEQRIRERPQYWIWSHRRWKHSRQA
jgi:Lauroyl/myristoyl acyltransferase